jgi:hypothetical protein
MEFRLQGVAMLDAVTVGGLVANPLSTFRHDAASLGHYPKNDPSLCPGLTVWEQRCHTRAAQ